jgi:hypothetical protein
LKNEQEQREHAQAEEIATVQLNGKQLIEIGIIMKSNMLQSIARQQIDGDCPASHHRPIIDYECWQKQHDAFGFLPDSILQKYSNYGC